MDFKRSWPQARGDKSNFVGESINKDDLPFVKTAGFFFLACFSFSSTYYKLSGTFLVPSGLIHNFGKHNQKFGGVDGNL